MKDFSRPILTVVLAVSAWACASAALAAQPDPAAANATAKCNDPRVDRTACFREAAAAQEAQRRGTLTSTGGYDQNALRRCQRQPESARAACEQRVLGTGDTEVRGSVQGGGKIRRTETPVPASKS